jgi:hypothetical protein
VIEHIKTDRKMDGWSPLRRPDGEHRLFCERRYKKPAASLRSGGPTQPVVPPSLVAANLKKLDRLPSLSLESQNVAEEDELHRLAYTNT